MRHRHLITFPRLFPAIALTLIAVALLATACDTSDAPIEETRNGTPLSPTQAGPGVPLTAIPTEFPASPVAPTTYGENCAVSWREAMQYIGLDVTLQGPVVDIRQISRPGGEAVAIALGAGPSEPNGVDVIIPPFAVGRFNPPPDELFADQRVCVRGYVAAGADRLRIYISSPDDITILSDAVPTPVLIGGQCDNPVSWDQAAQHAGERIAVRGPVVGSRGELNGPNQLMILELGTAAPAEDGFDVAIPFYALDKFDSPPREFYDGKTICVQGAITVVGGRARTYVDRQDSIFVEGQ